MSPRPEIIAYADGGARGNPGPAAIGVVVCDPADRVLEEFHGRIGVATNNEAEYRAVEKALELASRRTSGEILVVSDSELAVRQLAGEYRVRNARLGPLRDAVRRRERDFRRVRYAHRPRLTGHLRRADELVNMALDEAP